MRLRRLIITLPPRLRGTAEHDARAIAEAVGRALAERGADAPLSAEIQGAKRGGAALAHEAGAAFKVRSGGGYGG